MRAAGNGRGTSLAQQKTKARETTRASFHGSTALREHVATPWLATFTGIILREADQPDNCHHRAGRSPAGEADGATAFSAVCHGIGWRRAKTGGKSIQRRFSKISVVSPFTGGPFSHRIL